jgi:hypothetical protein
MGAAYSPIGGTVHTVAGEPVGRATGSPAAGQAADFLANWFLPGAIASRFQTGKMRGVKDIFSPETNPAGGTAAGAAIREQGGLAARDTAKSMADLRKVGAINDGMTETEHLTLMDAMQTGKVTELPEHHQEVAKTIKGVLEDAKAKLEATSRTAQMRFKENYFPEQFERMPRGGPLRAGAGTRGEGSGGFLLPQDMTIKEALQNGAKLKTTDPIANVGMYKANVDRFVATEKTFEQGLREGNVRYLGMHDEIPKGWSPVKGRLGEAPGERGAYAPDAWARTYNAHVSKGMEGNSIYEAINRMSNASKSMKLGLSGYHAAMETLYEAPGSMLSKAFSEARSGSGMDALKSAAKAFTPGYSAISTTLKGNRALKIYETGEGGTAFEKQLVDLLTRGGARMAPGRRVTSAGMEMASKQGPYDLGKFGPALAAKGKQFAAGFRKAADKYANSVKPADTAVAATPMKDGKPISWAVVHAPLKAMNAVGRIMDTISAPLFDQLIPRLKNGANMELMGAWMKANPNSTEVEQLAAARKIVDSIDNRFGEMVQDNIFWDKTMKQAAQVALTSYSYELGTVRELGGGVQDFLKGGSLSMKAGPEWSPKMAYTLAYPIIQGVNSAAYQYLKTGKGPDEWMDLLAPKTGGTDKYGQPERMSPIGYAKEPYEFINSGPLGWAYGKKSPLLGLGMGMMSGQDYRSDPIARPQGVNDQGYAMPETTMQHAPDWLAQWATEIGNTFVPISVGNLMERKPGTGISPLENVLGVRPAGMQYTNPEGLQNIKKGIGFKGEPKYVPGEAAKWKNKIRRDGKGYGGDE